ncbi:MAG TPA: hypothetical protein VNF49_00340 [Candidatus Binataceae bacterium]|nr:hypothetical protein [Candidatus Binataceae bacterium]
MSESGTAATGAVGFRGGAAALLIYLGLSMLLFGRALGGGLSSFYVGNGPDPPQSIWFLAWWAHALANHVNPLFTHAVWAPAGFNLAWTTNIPLAAGLMLVVTRTLGAVAAYNILCLLCPAVVGWAAFVLCRHIVREFAPALLGGFVFGFSPYLVCKLLGNIDLALVPMLPLAAYLTLRALDETICRRTFIVLLALVLGAQFLLFIETFATMTLSAAIAIAIALLVTGESDRSRIRALIGPIALSYALAMTLLAPYLYYLFAFGFPHGAIWSTNTGSIDLLNFLVPVPTNALGCFDAMRAISMNFRAGIYDTDAYLGLTLVVAIAMAWRRWHEPAVRLLILFAAAIGVLAMGSWMQVGGHFIVPMPWMIVSALPLIAKAMPARLAVYMFLAIAILCAMWMSARPPGAPDRTAIRWLAGTLVALSLLPSLDASFWATTLATPEFFSAGLYRQYLQPGETVVILPYGFEGDGMLWQALCAFHFRMAGGYTGFAPPIPAEYERWPIVGALYDVAPIPDAGGQFKAFLKSHDVGAVIFAGEGDHAIDVSHAAGPGIWHRGPIAPRDREVWRMILDGLDVPAQNLGGVTLYQLPEQLRAKWPSENPVALQARAAAGRFDTLLAAAYGYLAGGHRFSDLSPLAVQQAGLLPPNWVGGPLLRSAQTPGLMLDGLMLAPRRSHRVAVGVQGSYPALKPIIDKYRPYAAAIYFPYPRKLSATPPQGDDPALMTMVFDVDQLARAAHAAAPPEAPRAATPRSTLAYFDQPQPSDDQRVAIPKRREARWRKGSLPAQD